MQETKVEILTSDEKVTYAIKNSVAKNGALVVFVHGLGGNNQRHLFYNGARFFPEKGFDTLRINLYDRPENARKLHECSIDTHAADIDAVIESVKDTYEKVFLIGHSLAGPSIIYSKQNVTATVLWDPSIVLDPSQQLSWEEVTPGGDYFLKYGDWKLVSRALHDQWAETNIDMLKRMKVPTKIIAAGDGPLVDRWNQVLDKIPVPYEYYIVKGAGHGFDEWGTEEELFAETLAYLHKL